jgi:histidine triad (HIT) family protein
MTAYDNDNIFAKILRGELPCEKVFENKKTLVIMDIMPRCDGHVLVIPKKPSRNLLDIKQKDAAALIKTARKMATAVKKAFAADGVTIQQFNEAASGQVVFHTHVHIIPRMDGVRMGAPASEMANPEVLKANAEKIRAVLAAR